MKATQLVVIASIACSGSARADGLFRFAKCGVEVAMPATPVCQDVINETRTGRVVNHFCSASLRPPLTVYGVGCDDYSPGRTKRDGFLKKELQEEVTASHGTLVSVTDVQNGTLRGMEAVIEFLGHRKIERVFLVGSRFFHVGVVTPVSNSPDVTGFLRSFRLLPEAK